MGTLSSFPLPRSIYRGPKCRNGRDHFLVCPRIAGSISIRTGVLVPSCLVLDVNLPELNGLDLKKRIAVERMDMPITAYTVFCCNASRRIRFSSKGDSV
jgi:CheY-like chemotaxis protein